MKVEEILDLMDEMLDKSSQVPFSNKKMIDCEQMREYIDSIRLNMPGEIKRAKDMEKDQKRLLDEANKEAEGIIRKAEERAKALVAEQEILKQAAEIGKEQIKRAQEQADEIVSQAVAKDNDIRNALAANLERTLSEAEKVLSASLADVTSTKEAVLRISKPAAKK